MYVYILLGNVCTSVCINLSYCFPVTTIGDFFGETGVVFRKERTANIRALSICTCLIITKDDLDGELADCEFDVDATIQALCKLQVCTITSIRDIHITTHTHHHTYILPYTNIYTPYIHVRTKSRTFYGYLEYLKRKCIF